MRKSLLFIVCFATAFALVALPATAAVYQMPVNGKLTDTFRPPATPYGPGNRGWQFSTANNSPVTAAADGAVTFAGQVGGVLNVVITHDDGVLTTYSLLSEVTVKKGQVVKAGQQIGSAATTTYFGGRLNGQYIDPAKLFDTRVYLVPSNQTPATQLPPTPAVSPAAVAWAGGDALKSAILAFWHL